MPIYSLTLTQPSTVYETKTRYLDSGAWLYMVKQMRDVVVGRASCVEENQKDRE